MCLPLFLFLYVKLDTFITRRGYARFRWNKWSVQNKHKTQKDGQASQLARCELHWKTHRVCAKLCICFCLAGMLSIIMTSFVLSVILKNPFSGKTHFWLLPAIGRRYLIFHAFLTFAGNGPPQPVFQCHFDFCRRWAGIAYYFDAFLTFARNSFFQFGQNGFKRASRQAWWVPAPRVRGGGRAILGVRY